MTGNFRFSDKYFPANGKPPDAYYSWVKPRQRAWWDKSNKRKKPGNGANGEDHAAAPEILSLADEIKASKRKHRRRTGDSAREPAQDCQISPYGMAEESAEGAEAKDAAEPHGYTMTPKGLKWSSGKRGDREIICAGEFKIMAETRASDGSNWGLLLRWKSADGVSKDWPMPRSLLAGDGLEVRRALLDGGLYVAASGKARQLLTNYLSIAHCKTRARAVDKTGWVGSAFVFPRDTIGGDPDEMVILQTAHFLDHAYNVKGTLAGWKTNVARYAIGNSRLALAIAAGFAAPFVGSCGRESGGIHFKGKSSEGKTTALRVGGSVWGGSDEPRGFLRSWRATDNALESVAATHNDALLCLDEISQLSSKAAGDCAYMLANGMGKGRASRDATLRKIVQWNLLFLSSGEISLGDKISEDPRNKRQTAGQEVRVIDLPSDAGVYGLFDELHGFENGAKFADYLISACKENYGTPIRSFIEAIAPDLERMTDDIRGGIADFVEDVCPGDCNGQIRRAAARFGLIAAAGELATRLGILPWPVGEATKALTICFNAWVSGRGGTGAAEVRHGIERVRLFFEQHGDSRCDDLDEPPSTNAFGDKLHPDRPVHNRAGWRRGKGEEREWFILPEVWKQEICAGLDATMVARELAALKILRPGTGKFSRSERVAEMLH